MVTKERFVIYISGCFVRLLFIFTMIKYLQMEVLIISKNLDRKAEALVNENITASRVLVIDAEGKPLGEMDIEQAIKLAKDEELDLVCVAPNAKVPVCRFIDYSKYRYDMQRKKREAKKNQKTVTIKEVRVSPLIGTKDFETKVKTGREFLADGNKLKVTLFYPKGKRRLIQFETSSQILDKYIEAVSDIATVESKITNDGRTNAITLVPKKK